MSRAKFPKRGDSITVNGRQNPCAVGHVRACGEHGVVTSVDDVARMQGFPSVEVMFDTPVTHDGTRYELFYPMEISTEENNE